MLGYVGLGSDLGDRRAALREALRGMVARGFEVRAVSSVWETEPVDVAGSTGFLNLVAAVEVPDGLDPEEALDRLLEVERGLGRIREAPNRPRVVDLDLLILGDARVASDTLTLPHPRMWTRRFVLAPLAEIAPALRDPTSGLTVERLLSRLPVRPWARARGALDPHEPAPVYSRRL